MIVLQLKNATQDFEIPRCSIKYSEQHRLHYFCAPLGEEILLSIKLSSGSLSGFLSISVSGFLLSPDCQQKHSLGCLIHGVSGDSVLVRSQKDLFVKTHCQENRIGTLRGCFVHGADLSSIPLTLLRISDKDTNKGCNCVTKIQIQGELDETISCELYISAR